MTDAVDIVHMAGLQLERRLSADPNARYPLVYVHRSGRRLYRLAPADHQHGWVIDVWGMCGYESTGPSVFLAAEEAASALAKLLSEAA